MRTAVRIPLTAALLIPAISSPAAAAPPIHAPWPCGVEDTITQGHNTGNSHSATSKDAWAWDIGLGQGASVVAPFDGVVRSVVVGPEIRCKSCNLCDANVPGDCDNCGCWEQTNHVVIAFDDGTEAQLMHLQQGSNDLEVGDVVRRGEVVGAIGLSGQITGAHLHFHVQRGDADCSSQPWYCASVPASFVDLGDPGYPDTVTSRNCELEESCVVVGTEPLAIDDASACFIDAAGREEWARYDEPSDSYSFRHVPNASGTEATAEGYWRFRVEETALYRVEVLMPWWNDEVPNGSDGVTYEVGSGTRRSTVEAQSQRASAAGWVVLGESFLLREETESYVRLGNATAEAAGTTRVGFDQVRITRVRDYAPPRCAVGSGAEIEETDVECFAATGERWFDGEGGRDGYRWSNSNALASPLETGTWTFEASTQEPHELWVHVPEGAETASARYRLFNGYITIELDPVDQGSASGWVKLTRGDESTFELYPGLPARLSLGDDTGEPFIENGGDANTVVAFDSIAVAPASLGFDPDAEGTKSDDVDLDGFDDPRTSEQGCSCRVRAGDGGTGLGLGLLGIWALLRRRRRAG